MSTIQADIEARLSTAEPGVEVLLAEVVGGKLVRLFIDHPDGVTLDMCERVTKQLPEVREKYALEVSSPGSERPLTKPEHFRRFLGRRVRVKTTEDIEGRRSFTGRLEDASESEVSVEWLAQRVASGDIRWVLTDGSGGGMPNDGRTGSRSVMAAIQETCTPVSGVDGLYDCSGAADTLAALA